MKRIGILTIALVFMLAYNARAERVGYLVSVTKETAVNSYFFRTQSVEKLEKSIYNNTGLAVAVEDVFEGDNVFFEYRINGLRYYVEKRKVKRKKNGKLVYQRISKKERKAMARA